MLPAPWSRLLVQFFLMDQMKTGVSGSANVPELGRAASVGVFPPDFRPVSVTGVDEPSQGSEATGRGVVEETGRAAGLLSWPRR